MREVLSSVRVHPEHYKTGDMDAQSPHPRSATTDPSTTRIITARTHTRHYILRSEPGRSRAEHNLSEMPGNASPMWASWPRSRPSRRRPYRPAPYPVHYANRGSPPEPLTDTTPEAFRTIRAET
jgi:hypothetical protein